MPLFDDPSQQTIGPQNPAQAPQSWIDRFRQMAQQAAGGGPGNAPPPMPMNTGFGGGQAPQPQLAGQPQGAAPAPPNPMNAVAQEMGIIGPPAAPQAQPAAGQPNPAPAGMPILGPAQPNQFFAGANPTAPAAGAPPMGPLAGTGIGGAAASRLTPSQLGGQSPLPEAQVPAGLPMGQTFVNPGQGLTTDPRTWQNTALASGLPTFNQVAQQMFGPNSLQAQTPAGQQQIMQAYANLLQQQSNARTQAGQLGVAEGTLGLEGIRSLGIGNLPGNLANEAARTNEAVTQGQYARSPEAQLRTLFGNIATAGAAQGQMPTQGGSTALMRALSGAFGPGGGGPTPSGAPAQPPGAFTPGGGITGVNTPVPTPAAAAPGAALTTAQAGPPTGNEANTAAWEDAATEVANRARTNPATGTPDQQIGDFLAQVPPTARNVNALAQFLTQRFGADAFNNWLTGFAMRGNQSAPNQGRIAFTNAMRQLDPNSVSRSTFNAQSPYGIGALTRILGGR